MLKNYFEQFVDWGMRNVPNLINQKNFPYIVGSLFLLGVVAKCITIGIYDRMIRKANHMTDPKNSTLKQIKNKFDGIKQVNGSVANPMLLVRRHLNNCKIGFININSIANLMGICQVLILAATWFMGIELLRNDKTVLDTITYIGAGLFILYTLQTFEKLTNISDKKLELAYVIVDFLVNSTVVREKTETLEESEKAEIHLNQDKSKDRILDIREIGSVNRQEQEKVINQVIEEFLQ